MASPGSAAYAHGRARSFSRALPAEPMAIRSALVALREGFRPICSADMLGRLELVLAEVLNNIAEHGGADPAGGGQTIRHIKLSVRPHGRGVSCLVIDDGAALPSHCFSPRDWPAIEPDLPEGGFGLCLVQDIAGELHYTRLSSRNMLTFIVPCDNVLAA